MSLMKGSLIALVAFSAGFVAAMLSEPYMPGRAREYRYEVEALTKENDYLRRHLELDSQQLASENQQENFTNIPEATGPPPRTSASPVSGRTRGR